MNIVCPHCTTSFVIDPAKLGSAGRSVRCARCKQIWLAKPEPAKPEPSKSEPSELERTPRSDILTSALASAGHATDTPDQEALEWSEATASHSPPGAETPIIDSPSIASDLPASGPDHDSAASYDSAASTTHDDRTTGAPPPRLPWLRRRFSRRRGPRKSIFSSPVLSVGMAATALALIVWRADVVRLLPQTAQFYQFIGLDVNLRGLSFKDVKITTESVDNKPVLVIEGNIVDVGRKPAELPRLRFIVRDAKGAEIYAWNAVLEQAVLKPGEKAWFRSRLASPPPEGRNIEVRFFNRRDLATSGI